jgi:nucleoid-associated protein YgaU
MTEATGHDVAARPARSFAAPALVVICLIGAAGVYLYERNHSPPAVVHTAAVPVAAKTPPRQTAMAATPAPLQTHALAQAQAPQKPAQPAQKTVAASAPAPSIDVVRVDPSGALVMAGRAQPGETLTIHSGISILGSVTADQDGQWVFLPDATLPSGVHQLSVADKAANPKDAAAETTVLLSLPSAAGGGVTASVPGTQLKSGPMVVLSQGNAPPRLLLAPPGSHPGPVGLDVVQYDDRGAISFTGHARPGRSVRLYVNDHAVGDALANAQGVWTLSPKSDMPPGIYQLRTDELAPNGKVMARSEVPFARASLTEVLAPGQGVVQPGDCLWTIARHSYGHGVEYTAIFAANLDQIRDPKLIFPGQAFHMPTLDEAAHAPPIAAVKRLQREQRRGS